MADLNLRLDEDLKAFLDEEASGGGYPSTSEYVEAVLRTFWQKAARAAIEAELVRRIEGPPAVEIPEGFWDGLKAKIRADRTVSRA